MLKINTLVLGDYQTNCYIVREASSPSCVVIDPGYHPETVLRRLEQENLSLEAILLTHGHFDHVGGVAQLAADTDCKVYLCEEDFSLPSVMTAGKLQCTHTYQDGDTLCLAGLSFRVLHTPGHTPGSVCLIAEDAMFSGDTLFKGSCGRVDFPGSSVDAMRASLARLSQISENYTVYPGHGSSTTLAAEQRTNPFMRGFL